MAVPLVDQIIGKYKQIFELYYRLMLVVAPAGAGKTTALQDVQDRTGAPLLNVNLELSRQMLDLTARQRTLQLPRIFREIVGNGDDEMILLDNTEVIFDVELKQDPLRLLQGLSRNKTVVANRKTAFILVDRGVFLPEIRPLYPNGGAHRGCNARVYSLC